MERLAIVVRDDAYNRLYPPLTFASVAAKKGIEVNCCSCYGPCER